MNIVPIILLGLSTLTFAYANVKRQIVIQNLTKRNHDLNESLDFYEKLTQHFGSTMTSDQVLYGLHPP